MAALLLFDKKPQKGYVFWNKVAIVCWQSIVTKEAYEADSHCNNFFTHPPIIKHLKNLDNVETNDSRNVRTQVKDIIHNWIGKKTVDSHSYIARFRVFFLSTLIFDNGWGMPQFKCLNLFVMLVALSIE
ncbi:hypothetical protein MtrunA17_Chr4g0060961 [Medicago truncatula]|uniref:Uncharacterized protein n=1 Tax=Medicago truncatula TaxID=3880 RepID=A0A396IFU9_MEDTR|nr:hypothetical protein MtrunA17_Chr4g0060961 [Medicago truncatula]